MITYRELDGPLRAWLRQQQPLIDLCGDHIYFGAPDISRRSANANPPPKAWIEFRRIGGALEADQDARLDDALVTFDCCARTRRDAAVLSETLVNTLGTIRQPTALDDRYELLHAQVTLWRWEPNEQVPRYVVDMALMTRSWQVIVPPPPLYPAYVQRVLDDGAVWYWRLNEPLDSPTALNTVQGAPDATVGPNVTMGNVGVLYAIPEDRAAAFAGSGIGDASSITAELPALPDDQGHTVEWWCLILGRPPYAPHDYQIITLTGHNFDVLRSDSDGMAYPATFETTRHDGLAAMPVVGLHHYAITRRTGGQYKLYQDGAVIGQAAAGVYGYASHMLIGSNPTSVSFHGAIGHLAVYARELSAAELLAHYNLGLPQPPYVQRVLADGALWYWRLNEPAGSPTVENTCAGMQQATVGSNVTMGATGILPAIPGDTSASFPLGSVGGDAFAITADLSDIPDTEGQSVEWWCDVVLPSTAGGDLEFITLSDTALAYGRYHQDGMSYWAWFEATRHESFAPIPSSGVHHFVATRRTGGMTRLYIDGVMVGEQPANAFGFDHHMMIGGRNGLGFAGRIAHVAVYQIELTATQVAAHHTLGTTPPV